MKDFIIVVNNRISQFDSLEEFNNARAQLAGCMTSVKCYVWDITNRKWILA